MHEDEEGNWHADPEFAISMPIADWRRFNRGEPMNDTAVDNSMRKLVEAVTSTVRPTLSLSPAHGSYTDNARIAQTLKAMLHGEDAWAGLEPWQQESLDMICSRMGRILAGNPAHPKHWFGIINFANLGLDPNYRVKDSQ